MKEIKWILILFFVTLSALWLDALFLAKNYQYPDQGEYLQADDFKIFYRRIGKGQDVLFLHGIGASQYIWNKVSLQLAEHNFSSTLVDLPGFGRSSKLRDKAYDLDSQVKRLFVFCQKLDLKQINIVGSSMGGALALWFAKTHPELVRKLAVIGPATNPELVPLPFYKWPQASYILQFFNNRLVMNLSLRVIMNNPNAIDSSRVAYSLKNQHEDSYAFYTFLKATRAIYDSRLPHDLAHVNQPVLILAGEKDSIVPPKYIYELAKTLPNSELYFHSEGGHHLMEDEPDWVAQHILHFLNR